MKFKKTILGILLSAGVVNAIAAEAENTDVKLSRIEIRRTTDGIPHVLAHSWHGLGYGYGYAQAEDALCTLAEAFTTFRGRRSYFFGADSRPRDRSTFGHPRNIDLDFFFQAFANDGLIAEYQQHQPPSLNELIEGFAAGYNRYLRDARNRAEPEFSSPCLREYWVDEITVKDIFRRVIAANLAAGYARFIPEIVNALPPSTDRSVNLAPDDISVSTLPTRIDTRTGSKADVGSNFIAYGKVQQGPKVGCCLEILIGSGAVPTGFTRYN
ncbi:acyl-homoserine-lactone acylase [Nitrosospira sp. Nl5]|uniref:penicillin acylase family protein n=1 Tax=Nitrosospira sp. Nl5 TaxID=200120 RepID=UPI00087EF7D5|nr:penicillin acylase family protein [Nitrosospira sp. Nl5]SCY81206.1 acyl-homoserine-lactone acylase [Nitrosospira sp. Nl5]